MAFKIKRKYQVYEDPAHAWLKVKKSELQKLGIDNQITAFSYQKGENAYLEEDQDAGTFINAKKQQNEEVETNSNFTNKSSKIRNYESYGK